MCVPSCECLRVCVTVCMCVSAFAWEPGLLFTQDLHVNTFKVEIVDSKHTLRLLTKHVFVQMDICARSANQR